MCLQEYQKSFGSLAHIHRYQKILVQNFSRHVSGPVLNIGKIPFPQQDLIPPARITNLEIDVRQGIVVYARWMTPGDNFESGHVYGYGIYYTTRLSDLLTQNYSHMHSKKFIQKKPAGTMTSYSFNVVKAMEGKWLYFGLVPHDKAGNNGSLSNVAYAKIGKEEMTSQDTLLHSLPTLVSVLFALLVLMLYSCCIPILFRMYG